VVVASAPLAPTALAGAAQPLDGDAAAVVEWHAIATRTLFAEAKVPPPVAQLYLGITSLAIYDAVVSIEGYYEPYLETEPAAEGASTRAAVATAAATVLGAYFPGSAAALEADRQRSLQGVEADAAAQGSEVGERVAQAMLAARAQDGRNAPIQLEAPSGPGAWDASVAPMVAPWLGFVTPLVLEEPDEIDVGGPDPLTSDRYAADFEEVRTLGAATGSQRSAAQTETALFWSDNPVRQYQDSLRGLVTAKGHDAADAARTLGLSNAAMADSLIGCWNRKFDHPFWRPSTAIRQADTDGNPATVADPTWTPLIPNPAYPDYPSGHACLTGALTEVLARLYGSWDIDLTVASNVTGTSRHFDEAAALDRSAGDGRVWLGIHFRTAMRDGNRLGHETAAAAIDRAFGPLEEDHPASSCW
jgi:hypothetical protein